MQYIINWIASLLAKWANKRVKEVNDVKAQDVAADKLKATVKEETSSGDIKDINSQLGYLPDNK